MSIDPRSRLTWFMLAAGVIVLVVAIWQLTSLRPPDSFRLATGPVGTHSHRTALSYVDAIDKLGFQVEVVPTRGVLKTIELMQQGEVEAGFLDNTSSLLHDLTGIDALTAVYPEPIWIFYRDELDQDSPFDALSDLSGRISIGEIDSGSNELARLLFELNEVDSSQVDLVSLPDDVAASQLLAGDLDAAVIAGGLNSDPVLQLLTSPDVELLNLRQISAFEILVPFLDSVLMPEGVIRPRENRPAEDKHLLATQAVLSARDDLHPDIQRALLTVAEKVHLPHQWFESPGEYPTTEGITWELSPAAMEFHEQGPRILERYLPFWIASPLERFYLLALPIVLILFPLVRFSPVLYQDVMRRRIYRWYGTVREVELGLPGYTLDELDEQIDRLSRMSAQLAQTIHVPTGYLERYYSLRVHIRLVIEELRERRADLAAQGAGATQPAEQARQGEAE